jgi:hypothetical protein
MESFNQLAGANLFNEEIRQSAAQAAIQVLFRKTPNLPRKIKCMIPHFLKNGLLNERTAWAYPSRSHINKGISGMRLKTVNCF